MEREPIIGGMQPPLSRWLPVLVWAAVIFASSAVPDLGTGLGAWDTLLRKTAHVLEYALLGALLLRAVGRARPALALGIAYAASDEVHQRFVPGRHGSVRDVAIDTAGVALGLLAWRRIGQVSIRTGR